MRADLQCEVDFFRGVAFAESTKKTYQTHLRSYLAFCCEYNVLPVPASDKTVSLYAAYLARRLKPSSVKQYLNIVRIMHLECGADNPCADSWYLKTTLKGIEKAKGTDVQRKEPISPETLMQIRSKLNKDDSSDCVFWAACLIMFFGLLRKSNLFGTDSEGFNKDKHITNDCMHVSPKEVIITCKWSKSNQSKDHVQMIRLSALTDHPLCPVTAITEMLQKRNARGPHDQAFPMTGQVFNRKLRMLTASAGAGRVLSSHSFRRGGATWALSSGIPGEIVKAMGDWKSQCYLLYLDQIPDSIINQYRNLFNERLPRQQ